MKKKYLFFLTVVFFVFTLILSCPTTINTNSNPKSQITAPISYNAGDRKTFSADGVSYDVIYVPGKSFRTGTDDTGIATVDKAFWIAETETTYELWNKVYLWAVSNGYNFQNPGVMGDGSAGLTDQHPVTTINWRDAMVWCNALTEWYNANNGTSLTKVYGTLKDARDANAASCDAVVQDANATGFRLLTGNEWELAARYISDANNDGDLTDAGEYYKGDHVSGDTSGFCYDNGFGLETLSSIFGNYAWYSGNSLSASHPVKTGKLANSLGIFDMSGNVYEWNFDLISGTRSCRGGSWFHAEDRIQVGENASFASNLMHESIGFRISVNLN